MLRNYLKIALRNLRRQRFYSFINISGLAIGMACAILILLWVHDELSFDRFHEDSDNLYRVLIEYPDESGVLRSAPATPAPLAQAAKDEIPEVVNAARWAPWGDERELIKYEDKAFYEDRMSSADPSFLDMFSFPLIKGDRQTLFTDKNDIVVTERFARQYFGDEEPIGKVLNWNNWQLHTVKGVIADVPQNSHVHFDFITTFENEERSWPQGFTWTNFNRHTYLRLEENADVQAVNTKLTALLKKNNPYIGGRPVRLYLQPLTEIHLSTGFDGEYADVRNVSYVYIYSLIGFFILFIACINFINLSTARSAHRAKEIGMRKTIGANSFRIFKQYIAESFLLVCISQLLALLLVEILLPTFNQLSGKQLSLQYFDYRIILSLVAIVAVTAILAGSYPAIYLASFNPVAVLRGAVKGSIGASAFRKGLVVTQFSLSIILIVCTTVVYRQLHYLKNKELGFEKENVVYIPIKDNIGAKYEVAKNELLRNPNILSVTVQDCLPNNSIDSGYLKWRGQEIDSGLPTSFARVGHDYFKTLNLQVVEGRAFSTRYPTDSTQALILNEEAARRIGTESVVGEKVTAFGNEAIIVGVVKDAHLRSLHHRIEPQGYFLISELTSNLRNLLAVILIKISGQGTPEALQAIEETWTQINPDYPLEINFLDATYNSMYKSEQQIGEIVNYFTLLAILVSCLGLFGLAAFTAEQRTKEIGVRKVLGASVAAIVVLLSRAYTKWVLIANLIAWPVAYFATSRWLQEFAYHVEIGWWVFALAGGLALVTALLTVSAQALRAAVANPVDSLTYE